MKNTYDLIREKEAKIERLKKELLALHIVASLEDKPQVEVLPPLVKTSSETYLLERVRSVAQILRSLS